MRRPKLSGMILLLFLLLNFGCSHRKNDSEVQAMQDGVQVGNGFTAAYISALYKFQVRYNNALSFNEISPQKIHIDNSIFHSPRHPSTFDIEVFVDAKLDRVSIENVDALWNHLKAIYPDKSFVMGSLNGLPAVYFRNSSTTSDYQETTYVLTPRKDILLLKTEVHSGNGSQLIEEAYRSLQYDDTPPEVDTVGTEEARINAGDYLHFTFTARDALVGLTDKIGVKLIQIIRAPDFAPNCITYSEHFSKYATRSGSYVANIFLHPHLCPGVYMVEEVIVSDKAGNTTTLQAQSYQGERERLTGVYSGIEGRTLPVVFIEVTQPDWSRDTDSPELFSLTSSAPEIHAGEMGLVRFAASDKTSGIAPFNTNWGTFAASFPAAPSAQIVLRGELTTTADGAFAVEFRAGRYLPSGMYHLQSFILYDVAGNRLRLEAPPAPTDRARWFYQEQTRYRNGTEGTGRNTTHPVLMVNIVNPGPVDTQPPTIRRIMLAEKRVQAGSRITIRFEATDNLSGIPNSFDVLGYFTSLTGRKTARPPGRINISGTIRSLGGALYSISFLIPPSTQPGRYILQTFTVPDRAGNVCSLTYFDIPRLLAGEIRTNLFYVSEDPSTRVPLQYLEILPLEGTH